MLNKSNDRQVLEALARLQHHDDWQAVRGWLEGELARIRRKNDCAMDAPLLRMGQGAAQTLHALFEYQDGVQDDINRIRQAQKAADQRPADYRR